VAVTYQKERYKGEFGLDVEVKNAATHYYTWGALFFQVTLVIFFFTFLMSVVSITLTLLGLWYFNEQMKDFRFGI